VALVAVASLRGSRPSVAVGGGSEDPGVATTSVANAGGPELFATEDVILAG
jgi:hypothetical protein